MNELSPYAMMPVSECRAMIMNYAYDTSYEIIRAYLIIGLGILLCAIALHIVSKKFPKYARGIEIAQAKAFWYIGFLITLLSLGAFLFFRG